VAQAAKKFWGTKLFDFRRITPFCLEKRLSKHKMTIFSKNFGGHGPFDPWLRLWLLQLFQALLVKQFFPNPSCTVDVIEK